MFPFLPAEAGGFLVLRFAVLGMPHSALTLIGEPIKSSGTSYWNLELGVWSFRRLVPKVGIAPTSPPFQGGANLPQLLGEFECRMKNDDGGGRLIQNTAAWPILHSTFLILH